MRHFRVSAADTSIVISLAMGLSAAMPCVALGETPNANAAATMLNRCLTSASNKSAFVETDLSKAKYAYKVARLDDADGLNGTTAKGIIYITLPVRLGPDWTMHDAGFGLEVRKGLTSIVPYSAEYPQYDAIASESWKCMYRNGVPVDIGHPINIEKPAPPPAPSFTPSHQSPTEFGPGEAVALRNEKALFAGHVAPGLIAGSDVVVSTTVPFRDGPDVTSWVKGLVPAGTKVHLIASADLGFWLATFDLDGMPERAYIVGQAIQQ